MKNFEKYKMAEDRLDAFHSFCDVYAGGCDCTRCPISKEDMCDCLPIRGFAFWLDMEFEGEKPLPCPFCGASCAVHESESGRWYVECVSGVCNYLSGFKQDCQSAVAAHNRVAKAAIDANERESAK